MSEPASAFPQDCPAFWLEIYKLRRETNTFDQTLTQHLRTLGDHFTSINPHDYDELKKFIVEHSKGKTQDGFMFADLANVLGQLSTHRAKLEKAFKDWHETAETQTNETQRLNSKFEEHNANKKKYNEKMQKYLGYKNGEKVARMTKTATKIMVRKQQLEMQRYDIDSSLRSLQLGQEIALLKPLSAVMDAYVKFCSEGMKILEPLHNRIEELKMYVKDQQAEVETKRSNLAKARREFESNAGIQLAVDTDNFIRGIEHVVSGSGIRDLDAQDNDKKKGTAEREGQLYIPAPNFVPVWCVLKNGSLSIEKPGAKDTKLDLMLCTVKERRELKMRFVFAVISPSQTQILQADSLQEMNTWMTSIQTAIQAGLNKGENRPGSSLHGEGDKVKEDLSQQLATLRAVDGNEKCADCESPDPEWLSMNLGILVCLNCSGIHRSLGVHISKVRSCTMDQLDFSVMAYLQCIGNTRANSIWEATLKDGKGRPNFAANSNNRAMREMWIKGKYELKSFLGNKATKEEANSMLFAAVTENKPLEMVRAMAWGADPSWPNQNEEGRTALHQAVSFGSVIAMEAILQNSAAGLLTAREKRGWTPLHYAAYQNDDEIVTMLLARGGVKLALATDEDGLTPAKIAEQYEGEKVVPLLLEAEKKAREVK